MTQSRVQGPSAREKVGQARHDDETTRECAQAKPHVARKHVTRALNTEREHGIKREIA